MDVEKITHGPGYEPIFGDYWQVRRGGLQGKLAKYLLTPSHTPTTLTSLLERNVLQGLREFENRFGQGIITPVLIQSISILEVIQTSPSIEAQSNNDYVADQICKQLTSVSGKSWIRSFYDAIAVVFKFHLILKLGKSTNQQNISLSWCFLIFVMFIMQKR